MSDGIAEHAIEGRIRDVIQSILRVEQIVSQSYPHRRGAVLVGSIKGGDISDSGCLVLLVFKGFFVMRSIVFLPESRGA